MISYESEMEVRLKCYVGFIRQRMMKQRVRREEIGGVVGKAICGEWIEFCGLKEGLAKYPFLINNQGVLQEMCAKLMDKRIVED